MFAQIRSFFLLLTLVAGDEILQSNETYVPTLTPSSHSPTYAPTIFSTEDRVGTLAPSPGSNTASPSQETLSLSNFPSYSPTIVPTKNETPSPTPRPLLSTTDSPSMFVSYAPTYLPTPSELNNPTFAEILSPTTSQPSAEASPSQMPVQSEVNITFISYAPTYEPSPTPNEPTVVSFSIPPILYPTGKSYSPTSSFEPTSSSLPSKEPTSSPPTEFPTSIPSHTPTTSFIPTELPTTLKPTTTQAPSEAPTYTPTISLSPTELPTKLNPTITLAPSESPSIPPAISSVPTTTMTPTEYCFDSLTWFKTGEPSKSCLWVSTFLPNRCQVKGDDQRLAIEACRLSCDDSCITYTPTIVSPTFSPSIIETNVSTVPPSFLQSAPTVSTSILQTTFVPSYNPTNSFEPIDAIILTSLAVDFNLDADEITSYADALGRAVVSSVDSVTLVREVSFESASIEPDVRRLQSSTEFLASITGDGVFSGNLNEDEARDIVTSELEDAINSGRLTDALVAENDGSISDDTLTNAILIEQSLLGIPIDTEVIFAVGTVSPTKAPTVKTTISRTDLPTRAPTLKPTNSRTDLPTRAPTLKPTDSITVPTLFPTRLPRGGGSKKKNDEMSAGLIALIVILIILFIICVGGGVYFMFEKRREQDEIRQRRWRHLHEDEFDHEMIKMDGPIFEEQPPPTWEGNITGNKGGEFEDIHKDAPEENDWPVADDDHHATPVNHNPMFNQSDEPEFENDDETEVDDGHFDDSDLDRLIARHESRHENFAPRSLHDDIDSNKFDAMEITDDGDGDAQFV